MSSMFLIVINITNNNLFNNTNAVVSVIIDLCKWSEWLQYYKGLEKMNWEYSVIRYLHHLWSDTVLSESGLELICACIFQIPGQQV